jgi:putative flippase GtrA
MAGLSQIVSIYFSTQFYRFVLVGGIALIIHWISRIILSEVLDYGAAILAAYFIGMMVAYALNKLFVFPYSKRSMKFEVFAFFSINFLALPFVWLTAFFLGKYVFAGFLSDAYALGFAHGIAITLPVFLNFFLHKFITFRDM